MSRIGGITWSIIEHIVESVFRFLFEIVGKDYTDSAHKALMQFVRFGIVGVSNTVISYLIYTLGLIGLRGDVFLVNMIILSQQSLHLYLVSYGLFIGIIRWFL